MDTIAIVGTAVIFGIGMISCWFKGYKTGFRHGSDFYRASLLNAIRPLALEHQTILMKAVTKQMEAHVTAGMKDIIK